MNEKDWGRAAIVVLLGFLLFKVMGYAEVTGGFIRFLIVAILILAVFSDKFGRAAKTTQKIRVILVAVAILTFVGSWGFSAWFVQSKKHDLQAAMAAKSETFDPESEVPEPGKPDAGAMKKFQRRPDGTLEAVDVNKRRNEYFGYALTNPGTPEYWEEINEYYQQEAAKSHETSPDLAAAANIALSPKEPDKAFRIGPGQWGPTYTARSSRTFDIIIIEGCATVLVNGKYRVENACKGDTRLHNLRGAGLVPRDEPIASYQVMGGPVTGMAHSTWGKEGGAL